ncbi:hypothetical protein [Bradyrhizobium sp. USDA 4508]
MNNETSTPLPGPTTAPDFQQVRKYLRSIQQREALGSFIKAGWKPTELGEFARAVFLASGKTYPTAASYQYAIEKGADHPYAVETLATLRAPGFTMPPFDRPEPKRYAWDDPDSPEHTAELRADIEEMARLWRKREASWHDQPQPVEAQPIPKALWRKLFKLRNRYHTLADTLQCEALSEESQTDVPTIARCLRNRSYRTNGLECPEPNAPISKAFWMKCFERRARYSSLAETLEHEGLKAFR